MKKQLFEYAVLKYTIDEEGKVTDTTVVVEPTTMLGKTEKDVVFKVTRQIPEEHAEDPDNVQILIRNF